MCCQPKQPPLGVCIQLGGKCGWAAVRLRYFANVGIGLGANAGGVFEEAILSASFFLPPGAQIVETVRSGFVVDTMFEVCFEMRDLW